MKYKIYDGGESMIRLATIGTNFITDWLMEGILELDETTKRWQKIQRLMRFM